MNFLKNLISGRNKRRFIDRKFNLDLCYITPRIIVMSYPKSFPEYFFHDNIKEVFEFLNQRHGKDYLLINLIYKDDDTSIFNGKVINHEIVYHMPPKLLTLFEICNEINDYLNKNLSNVVVINCKGEKGRLGTVVCCYFLYIKKFKEIKDAINYYNFKRLYKGKGFFQASQKRYVDYFYKILKNEKDYFPCRIKILSIELKNMYEIYDNGYYFVEICDFKGKETEEIKLSPKNYEINKENNTITLNVQNSFNQELSGDIVLNISYNETVFTKKLGTISFNTAFLDYSDKIIFNAYDIDQFNLLKKKNELKNYKIQVNIKKSCELCPTRNEKDYCEGCKKFIEENKNIYENWKKIINNLNEYKEKKITYDKNIIFGNIDSDDSEYVLTKEEKIKSEKNPSRNVSRIHKINEDNNIYYEDYNYSDSSEDSEGEDYEVKYDNNEENKGKGKLNDSFENECFIF